MVHATLQARHITTKWPRHKSSAQWCTASTELARSPVQPWRPPLQRCPPCLPAVIHPPIHTRVLPCPLPFTPPFPRPQNAPAVREDGLPEGNQWRYSEFINAVNAGKVERVRFSKDGTMLQLTAIDGRRATVVLPNDPDLVDILAKNGVDISVSEGDQQGNYVALLGNILFPLIAFGGLFFLFRRAQVGWQDEGQGGRPTTLGGMVVFWCRL